MTATGQQGVTLWLMGLPASGKSTLASMIASASSGFVLLDGDEVRRTVLNFDMNQDARLMHLAYMAFCCRQLNACGVNVVAAFVTPLERQRIRIREILPDVKLIWLRCAWETCAARDPKGLWQWAKRGEIPALTSAGEWEDPVNCALILPTDTISIAQAFAAISERFRLKP